jgi:hypothetical protein
MARLIIALAIASVPAALAATPLVRETTMGTERHCYYAPPGNLRTTVTRRGQEEQRVVRIGLGEPCPQTYPVQRVQRVRPAPAQIPSMATLSSSGVRGSQRICVYSYLGQSYRRTVAQNRSCPLTPHFQ